MKIDKRTLRKGSKIKFRVLSHSKPRKTYVWREGKVNYKYSSPSKHPTFRRTIYSVFQKPPRGSTAKSEYILNPIDVKRIRRR